MLKVRTLKNHPTKTERIQNLLEKSLNQNQLKPGDKIPSEIELAKRLGVHRFTVNKAVSNLVQTGVLYRIQGKGTFVSEVSQKDGVREKKTIELVMPIAESILGTHTFGGIFLGIGDSVDDKKYNFTYRSSIEKNPEKELEYISALEVDDIDGLILFPASNYGPDNIDVLSKLKEKKFPLVLVDRYYPEVETSYVVTDDVAGAYEATTHLISLGHCRIACIGKANTSTPVQNRLTGYRKALKEHGIEFNEALVKFMEMNNYQEVSNYLGLIKRFLELKDRPTAIFAVDAEMCVAMFKAIRKTGLKIPEQIALVGYDDSEVAKHLEIPLTMVNQPFYKIGQRAIEILVEMIETGSQEIQQVSLKPKLMVRESSGRVL